MYRKKTKNKGQEWAVKIIIMLLIFTAWAALSYLEIIFKNTTANPQYSPFNIIVNFLGGLENGLL